MKPCAFTGQSLLDHSKGSLRVARKVMSDSFIETAIKRLERFDVKVRREDFEIAVLLHDIGKAGEYYQDQFDEECNPVRGSPSFIYHEIGSAIFFYKNVDDTVLRKMLVLAMLNHLNAIRGVSSLSVTKFPKGFNVGMIKLRRYGKVLLEELGLNSYTVDDYSFDDYHDMLVELARSNEPYLKLYSLFLAPIIVGDNLDSSLARSRGERRRFIQVLEKEVERLDSSLV